VVRYSTIDVTVSPARTVLPRAKEFDRSILQHNRKHHVEPILAAEVSAIHEQIEGVVGGYRLT